MRCAKSKVECWRCERERDCEIREETKYLEDKLEYQKRINQDLAEKIRRLERELYWERRV